VILKFFDLKEFLLKENDFLDQQDAGADAEWCVETGRLTGGGRAEDTGQHLRMATGYRHEPT